MPRSKFHAPSDEAARHKARSDCGLLARAVFRSTDRHSVHFKVPLQVLWLSRLDLIGPAAFRPDPGLQWPRSGRYLGDHGFEGEQAVIHETKDWSYALTPGMVRVVARQRHHRAGTESRV